jgi:hypothetical protein
MASMGKIPKGYGYLSVLAASVLATTVVWAEQSSPIPSPAGEMEQRATMSPAEQERWASTEEGDINRVIDVVTRMLSKARGESDLIRERCLDAKLTQLNKVYESFQARHVSFSKAGSDEQRDHYFRLLSILSEDKDTLRNEAAQCVGGDDVSFGRTKVTVERDPSITDDDTTQWTDLLTELYRPASVSGYY